MPDRSQPWLKRIALLALFNRIRPGRLYYLNKPLGHRLESN
jgi:hypothetical protein